MKRETNSKDLDRLLRLRARPDSSDMEAAIDDAWKRDGARIGECLARQQPAVSRVRIGPRLAFAATLIVTVAIGAYAAYRGGFRSRPQIVPPSSQSPAPSERAVEETPQVAVVTPEETKPGVGLSREEILAAQIAAAQATDSGAKRRFAAASVRPIRLEEILERKNKGEPGLLGSIRCLGADGLLWAAPNAQDPTARRGRCTAKGSDIRTVILSAYTSSASLERLVGFPDSWFTSANSAYGRVHFQIEGVADDLERVTKGELQQMLQALLEDRFKIRVYVETREVDGYALTIAKSGIKFKETSGDATCRTATIRTNPGVSGNCTMVQLTSFLRTMLMLGGGRPPFADDTRLMRRYNMEFVLEEVVSPPTGGGARGEGSQQARQFTTPIPKALEEQLGLRLERVKVPAEFVVIDHIEFPTEN